MPPSLVLTPRTNDTDQLYQFLWPKLVQVKHWSLSIPRLKKTVLLLSVFLSLIHSIDPVDVTIVL